MHVTTAAEGGRRLICRLSMVTIPVGVVPFALGPRPWSSQPQEIERVAVGIAQSLMPSTEENTELASRLAAQAAALDVDNTDILGLGCIDTQSYTLVPFLFPRQTRVLLAKSGRVLGAQPTSNNSTPEMREGPMPRLANRASLGDLWTL